MRSSRKPQNVPATMHKIFCARSEAGGPGQLRCSAMRACLRQRPSSGRDTVIQALKSALEDETGRWILGSRTESQTEISWTSGRQPGRAREIPGRRSTPCGQTESFARERSRARGRKRTYGSSTIRRATLAAESCRLFSQAKRRSISPQLAKYAEMAAQGARRDDRATAGALLSATQAAGVVGRLEPVMNL